MHPLQDAALHLCPHPTPSTPVYGRPDIHTQAESYHFTIIITTTTINYHFTSLRRCVSTAGCSPPSVHLPPTPQPVSHSCLPGAVLLHVVPSSFTMSSYHLLHGRPLDLFPLRQGSCHLLLGRPRDLFTFLWRPPRWPSGKASASRAEGPGFESRLRRDFFGVESYQ